MPQPEGFILPRSYVRVYHHNTGQWEEVLLPGAFGRPIFDGEDDDDDEEE